MGENDRAWGLGSKGVKGIGKSRSDRLADGWLCNPMDRGAGN